MAGGLVAGRNGVKRTAKGLWRGGKWAWRKARKAARRLTGRKTTDEPQPYEPRTADTIPDQETPAAPSTDAPKGTTMAAQPAAPTAGSSPFFAASQQLHSVAAQTKFRGMLEQRLELHHLPYSLTEVANAVRKRAAACSPAESPLHPAIAQMLDQIARAVDAAAASSQQLLPAFDALHPTEVQRLLAPRANEAAWDTTNNAA